MLVKSIAIFIERFLDVNRFLTVSLIQLLMGSLWFGFIFENTLIKVFDFRNGVGTIVIDVRSQ